MADKWTDSLPPGEYYNFVWWDGKRYLAVPAPSITVRWFIFVEKQADFSKGYRSLFRKIFLNRFIVSLLGKLRQ